MVYGDLVNTVERNKHLNTRYDVVCYLIDHNGGVLTETDLRNIDKLYADMFIDK